MDVNNKLYKMSFTAAGFCESESIKIAVEYCKYRDWKKVLEIILNENLLNKNKKATMLREGKEIILRLKNLSDEQVEYLSTCSLENAKLLILYAICRTYRFIYHFIIEVVREKYLLFDYEIMDMDYENFIRQKEDSGFLTELADTTISKVKSSTFKIMEKAGIIDNIRNRLIQQPFLSDDVKSLIGASTPQYLRIFLLFEDEIESYMEA